MHASTSTIASYDAPVTPEKASQWLQNNSHNRNKSEANIRRLAEAIKNDEWKCNGESIIIDSTGRLLDGQHRLEAVVLAKKAIHCVVVEGVDPEAFDTIDQGRKRSNGDVLSILGEQDSKMLAAACGWVYRYQHRLMFQAKNLSPQQVQLVLDVHSDLRGSLPMGRYVGRSQICPPAIATMLHYFFCKVSVDHANLFMQCLADGAGLDKDSPILYVRDRLSKNRRAVSKLPPPYVAGMIIKAWNRWIYDDSPKGIPMRRGDSFPVIEGLQ